MPKSSSDPSSLKPSSKLKVEVDKLAFGLKLDDLLDNKELRVTILRNATKMIEAGEAKNLSGKGKGFLRRFSISIEDDQKMLLQFKPTEGKFKKIIGFYCEYNPNKLSDTGKRRAREIVAILLGGAYLDLASRFVLIRVDYKIDVHGVGVRDVIFHARRKQRVITWGKTFDRSSELETIQLGNSDGPHSVQVYDKSREILSALAPRGCDIKLKDLNQFEEMAKKLGKIMRIEVRLKPRAPCPVYEADEIENPFSGIELYALPSERGIFATDTGRLFLDSVSLHGLDIALSRVHDAAEARKLRAAVASDTVDWWNPNEFQSAVVQALKEVRMFEGKAFDRPAPLRRRTAAK